MPCPALASTLLTTVALPVLPKGAASAPFAWSLVLSAAVVIVSLVPLAAGRSRADFTPEDLAAPRAMFERLPAWGKRANWAHQNSFEAFTLHAPACLLCLLVAPGFGTGSILAAAAAWIHPALRLGYIAAYVANLAPLRSLCWAAALICTGLLYSEGLKTLLSR